jgi:hypothetical protein
MSYDRHKVEFTDEEHDIAEDLDKVIESFSDGFDLGDVTAVPATARVLRYISGNGDKALAVKRLFSLAVMVERDNDFIA